MQHVETFLSKPAYTAKGHRIRIFINVDDPKELTELDSGFCDGIGLARTELVLYEPQGLHSEETQYWIYVNILKWADNRPVVIRTLDAGGDKSIAGLTLEGERNPFMGLRGVRLSLVRPELFRIQLRALARAAVHGPLKVMLPMVTDPKEINQVRRLMKEEVEDLQRRGIAAQMPPLGMMVEVPAAALRIRAFAADFYSVGSNDLIQFVTAACRDCAEVAALYDPLNSAVLELIRRVAVHGAATGKEVTLCGDMAAEPECIPAILDLGIKCLSVAPTALAKVKKAVSQYRKEYG